MMVYLIKGAGTVLAIALMAGQVGAQVGYVNDERHSPAARSPNAPGSPPVNSAPAAPADSSSSPTSSSGTSVLPGGGYSDAYQPNLQRTSFGSSRIYYDSYNYYSYLSRQFYFEPYYFNRFYRNSEPLITPKMLQLDLAVPMALSSQLLVLVDQLEASVRQRLTGKPANKEELISKSRGIQQLAQQIRKNHTVSYISNTEARKQQAAYQERDIAAPFSIEALKKLREMATDLNSQLSRMYRQSSTATVSVSHLLEPSLESLAKGIEKLSKAVQNSSKRL
jgi:hypothetical protein